MSALGTQLTFLSVKTTRALASITSNYDCEILSLNISRACWQMEKTRKQIWLKELIELRDLLCAGTLYELLRPIRIVMKGQPRYGKAPLFIVEAAVNEMRID